MGRIRILTDQVANQIAAGEVVDRPASVVKELLENALDAGATRIVVEVEAGGRKLIRIADNGMGMVRDDALLAFERHATSKIRSSDDLLSITTLGFRGEALPSIASIARVQVETRAAEDASGTIIEIAGGKILRVEDAGSPQGTTIAVRDLFFNTPARRKFLRAESTELSHVTALVTHYALVHPDKHFELHSASHALLLAPPVARAAERIFQIFGRDTLDQLIPIAAERPFDHAGLPEPPPWKRDEDYAPPEPGFLRVSGFVSKPELQKLNRNSIYVFVNRRLIRDRLILHAVGEAYRNVIPPTSFPVVLLFLEMPPHEVDVNVHPAKTEVRFRQQSQVHDFVRDSIRNTLVKARPAASFLSALAAAPNATPALLPDVSPLPDSDEKLNSEPPILAEEAESFVPPEPPPLILTEPELPPLTVNLPFAAVAEGVLAAGSVNAVEESATDGNLNALASLKPLGQLRESFILAVNEEGLWIIDQHVAHERVLFEKILRERKVEKLERQRLLMPLLVNLLPQQMVRFSEIAGELERNGFEVEPFGPHTIAVKAAPTGLDPARLERMLMEVLEQAGDPEKSEDLEALRTRIAASLACHSAIKVNMPLDVRRMEWLLGELAKTEHPTNCPHGRPISLRYSWKDIQKAFNRI
ncbi:MAG TPA: DNA mismatch repair endonuclease MutL [Acidobacteriaceae bacterium]|nr:DNA mismatch repair endonuclease MutL [Acidobacteriaceae bacterium]